MKKCSRVAVFFMLVLCLVLSLPATALCGTWTKTGYRSGRTPNVLGWTDTQSHSQSMQVTLTYIFTWVHDDPNNPQADPPPQYVNVKENAVASWTVGGFPSYWSASGTADCGLVSTSYSERGSVAGGEIIGESKGMYLREYVDSSSGTLTFSTVIKSNWTGQASQYGGEGNCRGTYDVNLYARHHHPINYRQYSGRAFMDAHLEFEYRWDSTSGLKAPGGVGNVDLAHIYIGEYVIYPGRSDTYSPPDPPFYAGDWVFNNPTITPNLSTRNGNSGTIRDDHYSDGRLRHPHKAGPFSFTATQQYRYHCDLCMNDGEFKDLMQLGITRKVENTTADFENGQWELSIHKSGLVGRKPVFWSP